MLPIAAFPPGSYRVHFHVWPLFHGTRILVTVCPFGVYDPTGHFGAVVHFQYFGGLASSETGYWSTFLHMPRQHKPMPDVLTSKAVDYAMERIAKYRKAPQLRLF